MREPPADYKNVPDNAKKLYRVMQRTISADRSVSFVSEVEDSILYFD